MYEYLLVRLQMVYEVIDSVNALLNSEVELMMNGAQLLSNFPGSYEVRSALYADAESVQRMRSVKGILGFFEMPARWACTSHFMCNSAWMHVLMLKGALCCKCVFGILEMPATVTILPA